MFALINSECDPNFPQYRKFLPSGLRIDIMRQEMRAGVNQLPCPPALRAITVDSFSLTLPIVWTRSTLLQRPAPHLTSTDRCHRPAPYPRDRRRVRPPAARQN